MTMLLAIASMLNVTAREWPGIAIHDASPAADDRPGPRRGSVRRHQRAAAKRRARQRARRLNHF